MLIKLKKNNFEISADSNGAELHSVNLNGTEYLWQSGDAWKRYAPILFPFICSPKNNEYSANGENYKMPGNHGFARDSQFELLESDETSAAFILKSSEETKKSYPYDFDFVVKYIIDDNRVTVQNKVVNTGNTEMYFYVGGHPAFNCPLDDGLAFDDYYVEFSNDETITQPTPNGDRTILSNAKRVDLARELFDFDVFMKDSPKSNAVTLKSDKSDKFVTVEYPMSNCIAIWSPTGDDNAKFVCLEPWTSVPVYADDEFFAIEEKPHAIKLSAGADYTYEYSIVVG